VGYRGKVVEQNRARELRALGWTLLDIATELGVAKSSVSLWVRDVEFEPRPRVRARRRAPNALQRRKAGEIERLLVEGRARVGELNERDLLIAGAALYAGEGSKSGGRVTFANTDAAMIALFCDWLRACFGPIDESRLRLRVYLHEGLDLDAAEAYWSQVTDIPRSQFRAPYRAVADPTIRTVKHVNGCAYVGYSCSRTLRAVLGVVDALLSSDARSGVAQSAEHATVNRVVESSSLSPGASLPSPPPGS
jgi:transcriptional regulator with XRE-family HTH domain